MKLNEVVPWGRSLGEYRRMFALTDADLRGRVLGCGDGPASFNAEATALGHAVVSCDPIYAFSGDEIRGRVEACRATIVEQARRSAHRFVWREFADPDALGRARLAAAGRFLADYEAGRASGRYVAAALPHLPFADRQFDLCVCSHFLFLYADRLDLAFHLAAVRAMLRVAGEVRVFPLLDLDGRPSPHVAPVCAALEADGWEVAVTRVPYEFQRGGDHMMVMRGRPA
jgi:hypothetical protein